MIGSGFRKWPLRAAATGLATRGPQGDVGKWVKSKHRNKLRKCLVKKSTRVGPKKRNAELLNIVSVVAVAELIKKTPKLTNIWNSATNPPASQPAAVAPSITSSQPTAIAMTSQSAFALNSSTSSADTTIADPEPEPGTSSQ